MFKKRAGMNVSTFSQVKKALIKRRLQRIETHSPDSGIMTKRHPTDKIPLSYWQERLWFLNQLEPGNPIYNRPLAVRMHGPLPDLPFQYAEFAVWQRNLLDSGKLKHHLSCWKIKLKDINRSRALPVDFGPPAAPELRRQALLDRSG